MRARREARLASVARDLWSQCQVDYGMIFLEDENEDHLNLLKSVKDVFSEGEVGKVVLRVIVNEELKDGDLIVVNVKDDGGQFSFMTPKDSLVSDALEVYSELFELDEGKWEWFLNKVGCGHGKGGRKKKISEDESLAYYLEESGKKVLALSARVNKEVVIQEKYSTRNDEDSSDNDQEDIIGEEEEGEWDS